MLCLSFFLLVVSWCCWPGALLRQHKGLPVKYLYRALETWNGDFIQSCWRLQVCLGETEGKICPCYTACFSSHQTMSLKCRMFHCKSLSSKEESKANEPGKGKVSFTDTGSLLCTRNSQFQPARWNSHYQSHFTALITLTLFFCIVQYYIMRKPRGDRSWRVRLTRRIHYFTSQKSLTCGCCNLSRKDPPPNKLFRDREKERQNRLNLLQDAKSKLFLG